MEVRKGNVISMMPGEIAETRVGEEGFKYTWMPHPGYDRERLHFLEEEGVWIPTHEIIWAMHYGSIPERIVFRNGNPMCTRLENLADGSKDGKGFPTVLQIKSE